MDANKAVLDLCGISYWHDAGYTGKLGMSGTTECFDPAFIPGSVNLNDYYGYTKHAYQTARTFRVVAPDARMVMLDTSKATNYVDGKPVYSGSLIDATIPYMLKNQVCVVTKSQSQDNASDDAEPYAQLMNTCSMFTSAGNYAESKYNKLIDSPFWFGVGALRLKDGKVTTEYYTSWDDDVDFSGFAHIIIPTETNKSTYDFDGTSAACPWVAAQAFLVNQIVLEKAGVPLTAAQMYAYLKAHSVDVDIAGIDARTGYGYVKLPKPDIAERELFQLTRQADRLYAESIGNTRHIAQYYIDLVKDWRLPDA